MKIRLVIKQAEDESKAHKVTLESESGALFSTQIPIGIDHIMLGELLNDGLLMLNAGSNKNIALRAIDLVRRSSAEYVSAFYCYKFTSQNDVIGNCIDILEKKWKLLYEAKTIDEVDELVSKLIKISDSISKFIEISEAATCKKIGLSSVSDEMKIANSELESIMSLLYEGVIESKDMSEVSNTESHWTNLMIRVHRANEIYKGKEVQKTKPWTLKTN